MALQQLAQYQPQDLKSVVKTEDIAQKAVNILKDEKVDQFIRRSAAVALGNLAAAGAKYAPDIANILKDEKIDLYTRSDVAKALGNLGAAGAKYVPNILEFLKDETVDADVRKDAAEALGNIRKLEIKEVVVILNHVYEPNKLEIQNNCRFLTYFLGGGTDEVKTLLKWLGNPDRKTIPTHLTHDEGVKTLEVFKTAWEGGDGLERLGGDLENQIGGSCHKSLPATARHYLTSKPLQ